MTYCIHRWAVMKRWSDQHGFHALQKCRRCQQWKRSDMAMNVETGKLVVRDAYSTAGLENESSTSYNPRPQEREIEPTGTNEA